MDLYPAIDLLGGRTVRLTSGDFSAVTEYDGDPVSVARSFEAAGARWIHVVDLDAARFGDPVNRPVVAAITEAVGVRVQTGGGVRSIEDARALLESGVARVVLGTAAVERPAVVAELNDKWPGRIAVGLDHRYGEVQVRGWTEGGRRRVEDLVPEVVDAGAVAVIVTDISRDGRMAGPDVTGLSKLSSTGAPLIASGGVRDLADVEALASLGLVGVIAGKAIYEGRLDVGEAIRVLERVQ